MAVILSPFGPKRQFVDAQGNPRSGAKLFFYQAGTSTKQDTYTSSTGSVANTNPIILDSLGSIANEIWFTSGSSYKAVLAPSTDSDPPVSPIWTDDNLIGINAPSTASEWTQGTTPTYLSATSFSVAGDQRSTYTVNRRVKTTNGGGTVYSTITSSTFASSVTTVVVSNDSSSLDSSLSAVYYSFLGSANDALPRGVFATLTQLATSAGASLIGWIQSGVGAVLRTVQDKLRERVSVKDYGAVGDGTTDDTAAFTAALTALSSGGALYVPKGTYKVSSAITVSTASTLIYGDGRATILKTSSATADIFTVTAGSVAIRDMDFQSSVTRSGGSYINGSGASNFTISRVNMSAPYRGITINGGSVVAITGPSTITDTVATTGRGIYITGTPYALTIDEVVMDASGTQPEAGIYIDNCGDAIITRCDIIHAGSALKIAPGNAQVVSSMWVDNCFFDTSVRGVHIVPSGSGGVVRCRFSNCWMASMSQFGVDIAAATGTTVAGIHFVSPHIVFNSNNGLWVSDGATLKDLSVIGGIVAGNVSGIAFNTAVADFTIADVSIGAYGGFSANSGYGLSFAGAISNCVVNGNRILSNTLGPVSFGASTGANVIFTDNSGYNPQGPASITVTASPFTYTAGHTPETVFVSGGTVSLVKVAGTTVFTTTNVAVPLSAGLACEVTYTVAPTMNKYRH